MSSYFIKGKGWRYDFTHNGTRHTGAWFETKKEARTAEEGKRKEVKTQGQEPEQTTRTAMAFLDLVNRKLDHVKAYNSGEHYRKFRELARKWLRKWDGLPCDQISQDEIEDYILTRSRVSPYTANKEIRYLRATFNFGKRRKWISHNPTDGISFLPEERRVKYVPPLADIDNVLALADEETKDYLWTIRETLGRVGEINRLKWDEVDLEARFLVLYTRKKRGGHLSPRKVWLTDTLFEILSRRYRQREPSIPWVFDHAYRTRKRGGINAGPFLDRREAIKSLCKKAQIKPFGFHALRHSGASVMDNNNVPIGVIQRILGHENRSTTEIYLHGISEAEREAMATYERARGNSHTESHTARASQSKGGLSP
jgi:integrase